MFYSRDPEYCPVGIRASPIHVFAPDTLIIWDPEKFNNLVPLKTDILELF